MRLTAAAYDALRPILNEMKEDIISSVENQIAATLSQAFANLTEKVDIRLNSSVGDDFLDVERELCGLNNTINIICDKIEEYANQTTSELMIINQTLMKGIINNRESIHDTAGLKCGGTWGWRRAVYLDMTDPNTNCPSGWQLTGYSKRTCGRVKMWQGTCDSAFFPISGGPYSQVCGRIRAYQYGLPDAFFAYERGYRTTIDVSYVCGVAVMHGSPRQHIWTFANSAYENDHRQITGLCPCATRYNVSIPPFVGEDYFCESGYVSGSSLPGYSFHSSDVLWDGINCHSTSRCCSFHNPPYFTKTLNQTTTDDLELRICLWDNTYDNIAVELVDLYVK